MRFKTFGRTGRDVCVVGQGTWDIPESGSRVEEAKRALRRGIELGMTHLDTAEMYGAGAAEEILGQAIAGLEREKLFVASKVLPSNASFNGTIRACERSLKRAKLEYFDLYMLHWPSDYPLEDTMRALSELVESGKARYVGVSNFDVDEMLEAQRFLGKIPLSCNQVLYHLRERSIEHRLQPVAREAGIPIVAYTPFGRGRFPRKLDVLERIAEKHRVSSRAVILAFLTREPNVFAIPKASRVEHVEDNASAGDVRLDRVDIAAIDAAFPVGDERPLATL